MVEDALAPDEDSESVEDFECEIVDNTLVIRFKIVTIYGNEEVEINV